ncbi:putative Alpha-L-fucosidase 2 [Cocos nucifera]|uniref:Putative Alpha-L-fucosidase 2 n=1 Tax=Cocos nucifera TaxID=13894 RepID=A0A8K0N1F4_COCNU|nr:putative Alpha-L-fucosidase 2 [Cocos nucifera]
MEEGEEVVWLQPPMEVDAGWWAGGGKTEDERPLKVQFSEPAKHFTDAAPIGNGRLGAMVWGGVASETLQLNHDTLWTGVPGNYTDPNAPAVLSKVRELVDNGQYSEASLAAFGLFGHPTEVYQPLGDINLNFGDSDDAYMAYERELDLTTATVSVKYTLGDVEFTREHFSSNPHQVLVTKISANKSGCLSFTVYLDSKLHHHSSANSANQIIMEGSCPGKRIPPTGNDSENPSGIKFSAILELQIGGDDRKVQVLNDRKLKVDGSDWAVLLLAASSSFEGPFTKPSDSKKDPTSACLNTLSSVRNLSYSQLLAYHLDDYQNLFNRVTLQLSKVSSDALGEKRLAFLNQIPIQNSPASDCGVSGLIKLNSSKIDSSAKLMDGTFKSTAERVKSFKDDEDPSLVELLFHYGRYLLISCSRPGTQVANLQGIWNKDIEPAWEYALS